MAVNTSSFSKSKPIAASDAVSDFPALHQSDKSVLQASLNDEHYFAPQDSSSSASGGVHRMGSARVFSGLRAALAVPSSADSAGRMFYATDTDTLHYIGASSATTVGLHSEPYGVIMRNIADLSTSGAVVNRHPAQITQEIKDIGGWHAGSDYTCTVPYSGYYTVHVWHLTNADWDMTSWVSWDVVAVLYGGSGASSIAAASNVTGGGIFGAGVHGGSPGAWVGHAGTGVVYLTSGQSVWMLHASKSSIGIGSAALGYSITPWR